MLIEMTLLFILACSFVWAERCASSRRATRSIDRLRHSVDELAATVKRIERAVMPSPAARVEFYVLEDGQLRKVNAMFLKVTKKLPISIQIKDRLGNPAQVDGIPQWAVTDPALASVTPSEDGMSAEIIPLGPIGSFSVQVKADADLGEGEREIMGELPIDLVAGDAEMISLAAGEPVDL